MNYTFTFSVFLFITCNLSAQNVGIGTALPQSKLHVKGELTIGGDVTIAAGSFAGLPFSYGTGQKALWFGGYDNTPVLSDYGVIYAEYSNAPVGTDKYTLNIVSGDNAQGTSAIDDRIFIGNINHINASVGGLTIENRGLYIGIGKVTPTKTLDVNGNGLIGILTPRYTEQTSFTVPSTGITATYLQDYTNPGNEHLYVLFSVSASVNWLQAQELARAVKGHLVTLTSAAENDYVRNNILIHANAQGMIPIGHQDALSEGRWETITGEVGVVGSDAVFSYWYPGEPNNSGNEDIAHFWGTVSDASRRWNDLPVSQAIYDAVIVEYEFQRNP